ncbi:MAG: WG repeat-containing protein [Alphaproteobacteria bacterium]|nr:WG repeat-containing protein [Alphaproteobacteria bacterium]MBQ9235656.1 WG repeat-containing protein [Alphaproteobacteria bacterium]
MKKLNLIGLVLICLCLTSCNKIFKQDYEQAVRVDGKPTGFYYYSYAGVEGSWGIRNQEGKELIPRKYDKMRYLGNFFVADSNKEKIAFSLEGERLFSATDIFQSGFKYFLISQNPAKKFSVYNALTKKTLGEWSGVTVFCHGLNMYYLIQNAEGLSVITANGEEVIAPEYKELYTVTEVYTKNKKELQNNYFVVFDGKRYHKFGLKGDKGPNLEAKQWEAEKAKILKAAEKNKSSVKKIELVTDWAARNR